MLSTTNHPYNPSNNYIVSALGVLPEEFWAAACRSAIWLGRLIARQLGPALQRLQDTYTRCLVHPIAATGVNPLHLDAIIDLQTYFGTAVMLNPAALSRHPARDVPLRGPCAPLVQCAPLR